MIPTTAGITSMKTSYASILTTQHVLHRLRLRDSVPPTHGQSLRE